MDRREFIQSSMCATAELLLPSSAKLANAQTASRSIEFHVAKNGNDGNAGTRQNPFATIERARQGIIEQKNRHAGPATVWVHRGTYYLGQQLVFGPQDSGTADAPITYAAWSGDIVSISGGRKLNCRWRPYQGAILQCFLPEVKRGDFYFTQLFIAGKQQIRARYPNYDPQNPLVSGNGYINVRDANEPWPNTEFHFDPATFTKKRCIDTT